MFLNFCGNPEPDTPRYVQWTIPSLLYQTRRRTPLVYKGLGYKNGLAIRLSIVLIVLTYLYLLTYCTYLLIVLTYLLYLLTYCTYFLRVKYKTRIRLYLCNSKVIFDSLCSGGSGVHG